MSITDGDQGSSRRALVADEFLPTVDVTRLSLDELEQLPDEDRSALIAGKLADVSHFYVGLSTMSEHVRLAGDLLPEVRALPAEIRGVVRQPDGSPAERVAVQPAVPGGAVVGRGVVTDKLGLFTLSLTGVLPEHVRSITASGRLGLLVRGDGGGAETIDVPLPEPGGSAVGELLLGNALEPLSGSIVAALIDLVDDLTVKPDEATLPDGTTVAVSLGEEACGFTFREDINVRRFPYQVLIRLVEPRTTIVSQVFVRPVLAAGRATIAPLWNPSFLPIFDAQSRFVDRVPVERPISVDGFRDQVIGDSNGLIEIQRRVPMAGTLGLGYVLDLAQVWKPEGHSLGNLVYSLPLAPGEQQRIAVIERVATAGVREGEALDVAEQLRQSTDQDSSTRAVFDSAFRESVRGSSSYETEAESSSWGVAGGVGGFLGGILFGGGAAGGGGSSSSSGSTRSALDGARTYTSRAAEDIHSSVVREASGRRRAQRSSFRLATETDQATVTTKLITNNNRTRAMTVQYWEVLRHFRIQSEVEGCSLVCFVPLDLVRFLPAFARVALDPADVETRPALLSRYARLTRHADHIRSWLPVRHREGLRLLDEFVANPRAAVDLGGPAATTVVIGLRATVLPFEDVWVSVLTRRGTTIGPVRLDGVVPPLPTHRNEPDKAFTSRIDLVDELRRRRSTTAEASQLTGGIFLPAGTDPSEIVGFEIRRSFRPLAYEVRRKEERQVTVPSPFIPVSTTVQVDVVEQVSLRPSELETLLGGPLASQFSAKVSAEEVSTDSLPAFVELPSSQLPIPATERQPALHFADLLKIERTLQHVLRNTVTYSKAVWSSLSAEERAIMLEGYTIGLPDDGLEPDSLTDPSQHVPLLNCVANQVLGFFGNSMIMPFSIPAALAARLSGNPDNAEEQPLTTGRVQAALTQFHREAFSPPVSRIALPTRGVLGEAVLGHCPSAERIDLTRFWNWQDAPLDKAPEIAPVTLTPTSAENITGPAALTSLQPIINNVGAGDTTGLGALSQALVGSGPAAADFDRGFTGLDQLKELGLSTLTNAEAARKDALSQATSLASKAMDKVPELVKAAKEAEAATKAGETEKQDKADKETAAKETAGRVRTAAAVKTLKENAASFLAFATTKPTDESALEFATTLVKELAGEALPLADAAKLFDDFDKSDQGARTRGSKAFLTAFGLI